MKNLIKSLRLTLVFCVFFSVTYVGILWVFGQLVNPNHGNAKVVTLNGKIIGAEHVGQLFTRNIYFHGRPSHAGSGYDGSNSCGSNKGAANEAYLQEVNIRIEAFLMTHPYLSRTDIPAEMVTASGSGLDPHITPQCAYVQVKRIAQARGISEESVLKVVQSLIEKPLLGLMGPEKVNVLKLNAALDQK